MRYRLLEWLACPTCGSTDLELETRRTETLAGFRGQWEDGERGLPGLSEGGRELVDVLDGALHCGGCRALYPIVEGTPRMLPEGAAPGIGSGHRWTRFDGAAPEYEDNFRDMTAPLGPDDYLGQLVLDAGCGFGRHSFYAGRYGAEVVALDNSPDAVASARANTRGLARVHVVQGDISRPPVRRDLFDIVFSFGVLHHLADPRGAFSGLTGLVRSGGRLQVWVYGPRHGTIALGVGALRGAAAQMDDEQLHRFSRFVARGLRLFSHTPYRMMRRTPVLSAIATHLPAHDHHRWPFDVVVADVYDRLRVPVTAYISGEELETWYSDEGFADILVTRRVRNNESFRGVGTRR